MNPMDDQLQQAESEPEVFLLCEGGEVSEEIKRSLTHVRISPEVTQIPHEAFSGCVKLIELQFNEGLEAIGENAFVDCTALRNVTLPSTATELGWQAFCCCRSLIALRLNEGLQTIGAFAFEQCTVLRSVTIPSTVTELGAFSFSGCSNLSEVIFLDGKRFLNQEFVDCGFRREEQGLVDREAIDEMLFDVNGDFVFFDCPLPTVKIPISWAISGRLARLLPENRVTVTNMILNLRRLDLMQNGNVLACFPVIRTDPNNEIEDTWYEVRDVNLETARSLYQVLQMIAFYELKESSIVIELALWKSIIDKGGDRACRGAIPGPAKSLIMEYCGFTGFLKPAF